MSLLDPVSGISDLERRLLETLGRAGPAGLDRNALREALALDAPVLDALVARVCRRAFLVREDGGRLALAERDGPLAPGRLRSRAPGTLGAALVCLTETGSTSDEAWRLNEAGRAPHGLTVVAETQTAGRGRGANTWSSPPGVGLWFSVVLALALPPKRVPWLTQVFGLSLAAALERVPGVAARVKWPNDVLVRGRKIAGILTEARSMEGAVPMAVVGVGLDVNQAPDDFPPELRTLASSLRQEAGGALDRARVLDAVLDALEEGFTALGREPVEALDRALRARSAILGARVRVLVGDTPREGVVEDQSLEGGIVLREDGRAPVRLPGAGIGSLELV